ncbi:hypothetical protein H6P81_015472 [Aristolochia fimbriata]|uniref:Uncharacterized protein n=1 Tax=Aristolochia fimbriata TaxID=158543 RepID=A0AAV7E9G3_ARIFI|nr:hypothetical protein H6P81_015472 [Aristolochia fimbriata]
MKSTEEEAECRMPTIFCLLPTRLTSKRFKHPALRIRTEWNNRGFDSLLLPLQTRPPIDTIKTGQRLFNSGRRISLTRPSLCLGYLLLYCETHNTHARSNLPANCMYEGHSPATSSLLLTPRTWVETKLTPLATENEREITVLLRVFFIGLQCEDEGGEGDQEAQQFDRLIVV